MQSSSNLFNIQGESDFNSNVIQSQSPVIVDFHASWCPPCKKLGQLIQQKVQVHTKAKIGKIDCDQESNEKLKEQHNVKGIPAVFLYNKGKIIDSFTGYNEGKLDEFLKKCEDLGTFTGTGISLGGQQNPQEQIKINMSAGQIEIDNSKEITKIQIRLANGESKDIKINIDDKVQTLFNYVASISGITKFKLLGGFPPKPIENLEQTIEQADLEDSRITQQQI